MNIKALCTLCNRVAHLDEDVLHDFLQEKPSLRNIHTIFGKLKCSLCNKKLIRLFFDEALIIDCADIKNCAACDHPIINPRRAAALYMHLCILCAEGAEAPRKEKPHPMPAEEFKTCPRCQWPTIVRERNKDGNYFIGCTNYPHCRWTMDPPPEWLAKNT